MTALSTSYPLRAALWMLGSVVSFTAMAIAARAVSSVHDSFEIMAARSLVGLVIVLIIGGSSGQLRQISTARLGGHALRNLVHFTGQNLWFWSLTMIPMAQVFALEFTSPIWVILLAPLVLNEVFTKTKLAAAGLGFVGILIVARPDFANLNPGVLAAAGSAVAFATTSILTKRLTKGETVIGILFWLTLFQLGFGILTASYDGVVHWPTAATLPWLALIGGCGILAHFSLTSALALAPASYVMPIDFLRLPLIAVIAAWLYAEALDPLVLLGGAVIFVAIGLNLYSEWKSSNRTPALQT